MVASLRLLLVGGFIAVTASIMLKPRIKARKIPKHGLTPFRATVSLSTYITVRLLYLLPWTILKYIMLDPSPDDLLDERDVTGKSPYKFAEIVPGQIWTVQYRYQMEKLVSQLVLLSAKKDEAELLKYVPDEDHDMLKKDMEKCRHCAKINAKEGMKGVYFKEGMASDVWMIVSKLASGGLVLYSPVKIDGPGGEVATWLASLGAPVQAIVSPCGAHHFFVKSAQEVFPKALVYASDTAGVKLAKSGVRVDVDYTTYGGLMFLMRSFEGSLVPCLCDGDPNEELVLFHTPSGTCMCADLVYGKNDLDRGKARSDGGAGTDRDKMYKSDPLMWAMRLYRANWITCSPNGILPTYRYMILDRSTWRPGKPPIDDTNAHRFVASLRAVLDTGAKLGTQRLVSCHLDEALSWQQGDKLIRASWDFLFTV